MRMEDFFLMFGNARKVTRTYYFISFPIFDLCRNEKQTLFSFSITPCESFKPLLWGQLSLAQPTELYLIGKNTSNIYCWTKLLIGTNYSWKKSTFNVSLGFLWEWKIKFMCQKSISYYWNYKHPKSFPITGFTK